ncbi:alpha-L-fucosidase [Lacibacter cauensis]|uniref:alpha-L-fucosidase n=1 Tax=Lacibacter cauensis TaxID=510947 RepID=A0A562SWJ2_9BACT|nr:alpha-L-fucosidase [Lacibacter cauensis]TWI85621.1 alpha-L-fucosidase [Lacibacter cauensis]
MHRRTLLKQLAASVPAVWLAQHADAAAFFSGDDLKIADGPFQPNWDSLQQYKTPDWYRNAKFGIWAHWGPQCEPEFGDWYAREMYMEGNGKYNYHVAKYGHPSEFGFKDVINAWKADQWNPDELLELYKNAGAKYFMALANHHDNFDLYNSKYHKWNSTKIGPKKDLVGGWAKAARKQGLHFGVSVHAAHAWSWYETAQRSDKNGPKAGISYDGKLTKKDGKGKWWEGLDPQELYAQNHALSKESNDNGVIHAQWDWGAGVSVPDKAYCEKFFKRTIDLIDKYDPDVVYFDDTVLPLYPISDVGLKIAAHLYNKSIKTKGSLQAVINGKILNEQQRKCMVWDIERGQSNSIEPLPWQTDTCIGSWHYNKPIFDNHRYKSAKTVVHTLVDVVSKNGNLMLSVPVKGNGTIDSDERKIVEEIGRWMKANSESIYDTRPWNIFGEGPALENTAPLSAQGFNEGKGKPMEAQDIRFVVKDDVLYATVMGWPENGKVLIKNLGSNSQHYKKKISKVELLSTKQTLAFEQTAEGLLVSFPENRPAEFYANALKVVG